MVSKTEKPEWRDFDCPQYNRCLDRIAKMDPNGRFDCGECVVENFPGTDPEEKEEPRMDGKKKCSKCGIEKELEQFSVNRANPDGREYKCKECWKDIRAEKTKAKVKGIKKRQKMNPKETASIRPRENEKSEPAPMMKATPVEIMNALRKGFAREIIQVIEENFA